MDGPESVARFESVASWKLWLEPESAAAVRLFLLEELRGTSQRTPLATMWLHVSRFLRFPAPMQMIYLFGGRRRGQDGRDEPLASAEVFDWWCQEWHPLPPMSSKRVGPSAAVIGRFVVVAGGYGDNAMSPLDTVEAFDPAEGCWIELPPMPTRRYGLGLASSGGCLFAIGGDDGERVCAANEIFDVRLGEWRKAAPLPRALSGGKAEAYGGRIYYVGGCDQDEQVLDTVFAYCPETDTWELARPSDEPTNQRSFSTSASNNAIDTAEGGARNRSGTGGGESATHEPLRLRIGRTSFAMSLLRLRQIGAQGVELTDDDTSAQLVVTGGVSGDNNELFLSDTELLTLPSQSTCSGALPSWSTEMAPIPQMPKPRSGCRSVVLWPTPERSFLPWDCDDVIEDVNSGPLRKVIAPVRAPPTPFVVILGGETPNQGMEFNMVSCQEPIALDVKASHWHDGLGGDNSNTSGVHKPFLDTIGKLKTSRVAFAITIANGLPRASAHGG